MIALLSFQRIPILCSRTRGKEKLEQLPFERFLQGFEFSRTFLPPVSHGVKRAKLQKPVKNAHKAVVLIFLSLYFQGL